MPYLVKPNQQAQTSSSLSPQVSEMETSSDKQGEVESARSKDPVADIEYRTPDGYAFSMNRSVDYLLLALHIQLLLGACIRNG
jgi:1-phosphatidylinositol-3-phosphate 5-kinase